MSTDDDFTAYVGTHWSTLVRAALLLGCETARAESVVSDALVRGYQHWARIWQDDRADIEVLTHLLDGVYQPVGRIWRGEKAAPGSPSAPSGDTEVSLEGTEPPADATVAELIRVLLPLEPVHRDVLVLRYVAELDDLAVGDVLAVRPATVQHRLEGALAAVQPTLLEDECR